MCLPFCFTFKRHLVKNLGLFVNKQQCIFRPKRQRKLPARMQNNDFEYGFGSALAVDPDNTSADEVKPEEKPAATRRRRGPPPNRKGGKKAKGLDTSQDEKEVNHVR